MVCFFIFCLAYFLFNFDCIFFHLLSTHRFHRFQVFIVHYDSNLYPHQSVQVQTPTPPFHWHLHRINPTETSHLSTGNCPESSGQLAARLNLNPMKLLKTLQSGGEVSGGGCLVGFSWAVVDQIFGFGKV